MVLHAEHRHGTDHHHHHQPPPPRRPRRPPGPLKALRQAVALMNSLLQLVFSSGDVFGTFSSALSMPTPDLGRRRGGASEDDDRRRWRGGREEDEKEAEEGQGGYLVTERDFNSWDAWQRGGRRTPQQPQQQRRRKKMTFSTRYSCSMGVVNASRLEEYMALPFDQYSLLDQSFISRVEGNLFRFMVPANELVGLQTVPIVDVRVDVDSRKRVLAITSISSRFVSRATDGTILGTHAMDLLTNNSLSFSTRIAWDPHQRVGGGGEEGGDEGGGGGGGGGGNGPGANLARLRKRIFRGGSGGGGGPQFKEEEGVEEDATTTSPEAEGEASFEDSFRTKAPPKASSSTNNRHRRKLSCRAHLEVGVVVPPPFSLLPGLVLRQGASLILSTLVGTLVNRFLELLIEDFHKWKEQASREASAGALLGYDPQNFEEREIEVSEEDEEDDPPLSPPPAAALPPPEYII